MAPSLSAISITLLLDTNRNSASESMKRVINQGQATLSMGLAEARSLDPRALHAEADAALHRSKQARAEAHTRRTERRWGGNLSGS